MNNEEATKFIAPRIKKITDDLEDLHQQIEMSPKELDLALQVQEIIRAFFKETVDSGCKELGDRVFPIMRYAVTMATGVTLVTLECLREGISQKQFIEVTDELKRASEAE